MRALEFAKPVVRITNNGITAVINEKGQIAKQLEQNKAAVLPYDLAITKANTPYQQFGNLLVWLSLFLISVYAYWRNSR